MHYLRNDHRIDSLKLIILGLENSISELNKKYEEDPLFWENFYSEELEPIVGLAFIALQNYINSSIFDLFETVNDKHKRYKQDKELNTTRRTRIELIIGLANYFKHRDNNRDLDAGTSKILSDIGINYNDSIENYYSPIFIGLESLSANKRLSELIDVVKEWRENLWLIEENAYIE
jgi:uncharacterized protein YjiS (DUF1127 family)